jgi:7-cyano-7-deazaguanine synthase
LIELPNTNGVVVVLSGGMDSTIATRFCVEKYGADNVRTLTFDYGQKQRIEVEKAREVSKILQVRHKVFNLSALGEISLGFSANVDPDVNMPTIRDVLGDPRPKTYVPNRNMILMSIAAAFAEVEGFEYIVMGLQIHDEYGYHDTTQRFVNKINDVLNENRITKIKVISPFAKLSKYDEIMLLKELDGNVELLRHTLTCYNPDIMGSSCGVCPSCSERIGNFMKAKIMDPIHYQITILWGNI